MTAVPEREHSADLVAAWEAACLEPERRQAFACVLCAVVLIPSWTVFDFALEPELATSFLPVRLAATVAGIAALAALRRATSTRRIHAVFALYIGAAGAGVAFMLPWVDHFAAYLFGFSLFFWGPGFLVSWPPRRAAALFTSLLFAAAAFLATWPTRRDGSDFVLATFFLASAAIVSTSSTYGQRRERRRAFAGAHALAQKNAELQATLERLQDAQARLIASEKLSALGRLLSGLSHEINNPLNLVHNNLEPVRGYLARLLELLQLARSDSAEDRAAFHARWQAFDVTWMSADLEDAVGAMRAGVERIRQVHRDLRAYIHGTGPERCPGQIADGLRATIALLSRRLPDGVRIEAEVGELPDVVFQSGPLNQVWHNLIQNALDAVGASGTITVRAEARGDVVDVSVSDTGPGVAPEARARLFEPFFTTKGVGVGTGLGLAISRQIVAAHDGSLCLDQDYRSGARFVVTLPAVGRLE